MVIPFVSIKVCMCICFQVSTANPILGLRWHSVVTLVQSVILSRSAWMWPMENSLGFVSTTKSVLPNHPLQQRWIPGLHELFHIVCIQGPRYDVWLYRSELHIYIYIIYVNNWVDHKPFVLYIYIICKYIYIYINKPKTIKIIAPNLGWIKIPTCLDNRLW